MSFATKTGSAHATGLNKQHGYATTKQAMANASTKDMIDSRSSIDRQELRSINDADSLKDLLHDNGCKVAILKLVGKGNDTPSKVTYEVTESNISDPTTGQINEDTAAAANWVKETKSSLSKSHEDLICLAWTSKDMMRLANAFCQSLSIDATHKTVKIDGLSLLTMTVKDSFGKTTVIMRLWIPNQRQWMFRYVLLEVIPKLLGASLCTKVRAFITDGDKDLIAMIDLAISSLYINAVRMPCAWHIIDRPMQKQRSYFHTHKGVSVYFMEWFCRFLQRWLFTWMRPSGGIYSKEEFEVSKAILLALLEDDSMNKRFTASGKTAIKEYVLGVLRYEHQFLACDFMDIFALEVYSNCAHEGTNSGAKRNSSKVSATSSLGTSTYDLIQYDNQTSIERLNTCISDYFKNKQWTDKRWHGLTTNAASIVADQMEKTGMVVRSQWDPDSFTFYVQCPNDIHRHSSLHVDKVEKLAKQKLEKIDLDNKRKNVPSGNDLPASTEGHKMPSAKRLKGIKGKKGGGTKNPTKKDLTKMTFSDLLKHMSGEEKEQAGSLEKQGTQSKNALCVPEFVSAFKVPMRMSTDGNWYLACSCQFGKRFGSPCTHMFHVFEEYLEELGVCQWGYKNVSFIHWSIYSYVYATMGDADSPLTHDEKLWMEYFQRNDPCAYSDVKCIFGNESMVPKSRQDLIKLLEHKVKDFVNCESPKVWSTKPAEERVSNYSASDVKSCMKKMKDGSTDIVNTSQFEVEFSQEDGWESFGDIFNHSQITTNGPNFGAMFDDTAMDNGTSRDSRKQNLIKEFYEVLNTTNLKDDLQYDICKRYLVDLKGKLRSANEVGISDSQTDDLVLFPNSSSGDNCTDRITKNNR